jgi:hypothetical protein
VTSAIRSVRGLLLSVMMLVVMPGLVPGIDAFPY